MNAEMLQSILGERILKINEHMGQITVTVDATRLSETAAILKNDPNLRFDFLLDVVGLDNLPAAPRFEVIYILKSSEKPHRLRVSVAVPAENATLPTVTGIWRSADWAEREVFDMYGVRFTGHPNLKRILMWDEFTDHPLRKDYPLKGKGEERVLDYSQPV